MERDGTGRNAPFHSFPSLPRHTPLIHPPTLSFADMVDSPLLLPPGVPGPPPTGGGKPPTSPCPGPTAISGGRGARLAAAIAAGVLLLPSCSGSVLPPRAARMTRALAWAA